MKPAQPIRGASQFRLLVLRLLVSQLCVLLMAAHGHGGESSPQISVPKATVLMRLKNTLNGRPTDLSGQFLYGLAQVESVEFMGPVVPNRATVQDADGQWLYFELPSGTYHFWLIPPRTELRRYRFQFSVPEGQSVVYVGTIQFNCWSKSAFFGHALDFCWDRTAIVNDTQLAQPIAASLAGQDIPFLTSLMQPYGLPPPKDFLLTLEPVSIVTKSGVKEVNADWSKRPPMKRSAPTLGEAIAIMLLSPGGLAYGGPVGAGTFFLLGLYGAGAAVAEAQAEARQNEQVLSQWAACQKNLEQELAGLDASNSLQKQLTELMKKPLAEALNSNTAPEAVASPQEQAAKSYLEAEILQVIMRECQGRDSLCVGLMVRTRLWSAQERRYVYDWVFLQPQGHTASRWNEETPFPWWDMPFYNYDVPVNASALTARTIDAYCGDGGSKLFSEDLNAAVAASAQRIYESLGRRP